MFSKTSLTFLTLIMKLWFSISAKEIDASGDILHRSRRQLIYPNTTLLQFNAGFGFPSSAKNINVNYAFQANFQLPWNRTQIPVDILDANSGYVGTARKKRDTGIKDETSYQDDAKLHHFYKLVEGVLDSSGYKGQSCVLQTLCQLGAEPLHSEDEEDLLHEMASFVLNPTNDISHAISEGDEVYPYVKAYKDGQKQQPCTTLYNDCSISLIDLLLGYMTRHEIMYMNKKCAVILDFYIK